jgi:hypothetical protein
MDRAAVGKPRPFFFFGPGFCRSNLVAPNFFATNFPSTRFLAKARVNITRHSERIRRECAKNLNIRYDCQCGSLEILRFAQDDLFQRHDAGVPRWCKLSSRSIARSNCRLNHDSQAAGFSPSHQGAQS